MKTLLPLACAVLAALPSLATAQTAVRGWGGAAWVWDQPEAQATPQSNEPRYLRRRFTLKARPAKAELWITADNHYVAYVNGTKVGADSRWESVEKYDVTRHLVAGTNVLALVARNAGGPAGIIARLQIRTADKKDVFIVTDGQMRVALQAPRDWLAASFDDSTWATAAVLGGAEITPWNLGNTTAPAGADYSVGTVDPKVKARLSAQEQSSHFRVPKGFELELVAADPLVINPITLALDGKGRLYVSESHTYRYGPPGSPIKPFANPVIRLDPIPGGKGYRRTLIADGFADPVMGIAIKGDKLWLTANNYLYQYDLSDEGPATNKKTLVIDKNKAWNPFGMFVLEWGLDGRLLMSVGDHRIDLRGPDGKLSGRGNSGIVMRMNPDGTKMERLVHGMRVPYSFEEDPFGQLWVLSNGEGNPNRFLRVIDGVDYHCYSRGGVDNVWLAGNHPLAPPCFELARGAHTQLMRYYGAAFPAAYQGNLFLDNWGAHGFTGPNRAIFRFVPDERGEITTKEALLSCTDPHFRPSHILLDPDGNLLVADWYGRDDESDKTGRIWRLKYTGPDRPKVTHRLDAPNWAQDAYAISALGSPNHLIREKALDVLAGRGDRAVPALAEAAASAKEPLGAAHALWALLRIGTPRAQAALASGARHRDAPVRRLAVTLLRRCGSKTAAEVAQQLARDTDPAVCVAAALAHAEPAAIRAALLDALARGAAKDRHLRYEAAWHLARHADAAALAKLLASDDEGMRRAGMIAIDVACFEDFPTKKTALAALGHALEQPGPADVMHLLTLAKLDADASVQPTLVKLIARPDQPPAVTARAILVLRGKGGLTKNLGAAAGKRLLEAVEKGTIRLTTPADQLMMFELLEAEGPSPFALRQVASQLRGSNPQVREAAHGLARRFGPRVAPLADTLWPSVLDTRTRAEDAAELLTTLARVESAPNKARWRKLLVDGSPLLRTEAVRSWRNFKGRSEMVEMLLSEAPALVKTDTELKDDLAAVLREVGATPAQVKALGLPELSTDKEALARQTLAALGGMTAAQKRVRAIRGKQVFERAACTKCHTTATQTTPLAPSLKGIAAQKADYLVESVLYPSKVIKTGFESETITTRDGKILSGLVKDEGTHLRVLNLGLEVRIAKTNVEERTVQRVSVMPEGQEATLSRREFADLIAYLMTLR